MPKKDSFTLKSEPLEQPPQSAAEEAPATPEKVAKPPVVNVRISPPKIQMLDFIIRGTSHLSVNRFSQKAQEAMETVQKAGSTSRSRKTRTPKDFKTLFEQAQYVSTEDWQKLHAAGLRNALISACRLVEFKMTLAKMALFVMADGYDKFDRTPLLRIYGPDPEMWVGPVRNATGVFDLRARPRWNPGEWEMRPRIRFDSDIFTVEDVTNLVSRVGFQVGLGEGRPDSKNSAGLEYGLFELGHADKQKEDEKAA